MRVKRCSPNGAWTVNWRPLCSRCCRCWRGDGCVPPRVTTCGRAPISRMRCAASNGVAGFSHGRLTPGWLWFRCCGPSATTMRRGPLPIRLWPPRQPLQSRRRIGGALRVRGLVEGGKQGLELFRQAADTLATSPALLWRAQAYVDLGAALRRDGQAVSARPILRDGMEPRTPMWGHTARRPGRRRAARRRRPTPTASRHRCRRADRQRAAGRRAGRQGRSNKEIAQSLFVTLRTVELHLSNAYSKLEIRSRHELARSSRTLSARSGKKTSVDASVAPYGHRRSGAGQH